jgi:hypothetical protein
MPKVYDGDAEAAYHRDWRATVSQCRLWNAVDQKRSGPLCLEGMSVLAPITDSVSTMRASSYLPAPKEQLLAPPNRPRLAENKRSGSALRSQCRRGDDVVAGPPEQQRHDGAV